MHRKSPRGKVMKDGAECWVIVLGGRGKKQAVGSREPPDHLVFAVQHLAELEAIALPLEPRGPSPVRPREQPFFLDARRAQLKPVPVSDTVHHDIDLVQGGCISLARQQKWLVRSTLHVPPAMRFENRRAHEPQRGEYVALARCVGTIDRHHRNESLAEAFRPKHMCLGLVAGRDKRQDLLVAKRPVIFDAKLDEQPGSPTGPSIAAYLPFSSSGRDFRPLEDVWGHFAADDHLPHHRVPLRGSGGDAWPLRRPWRYESEHPASFRRCRRGDDVVSWVLGTCRSPAERAQTPTPPRTPCAGPRWNVPCSGGGRESELP